MNKLFFLFALISCSHLTGKNSAQRDLAFDDESSKVPEIVTIKALVSEVNLCGKKFSKIDWVTNHQNFIVETEISRFDMIDYPVPSFVRVSGIDLKKTVNLQLEQTQISLPAPLLPSIPILTIENSAKICSYLTTSTLKEQKTFQSNQLQGSLGANNLVVNLKRSTLSPLAENRVVNKAQSQNELIIYYDDLYVSEVEEMAKLVESKGMKTTILAISDLPGINPADPIPDQCQAPYTQECYYTFNSSVAKNISEDYVSSLHGFVRAPKVIANAQKMPYIPGLIRAHLRHLLANEKIKYALLIGSPKKLAPFRVTQLHHDQGKSKFPSTYIHTDLFFMIPEGPLKLSSNLSFDAVTSTLWSCQDTTDWKIRLRKWCGENEIRFWAKPALSAYRDPIYAPQSIAFEYESYQASRFKDLTLEKMIAVGRIPTQEEMLGGKDPIVKNYLEKMEQWFSQLPRMQNNSFATYGGTTGDSWIFELSDTRQFQATYGSNNKIYASEHFVPLSSCQDCEYKKGDEILPEMAQKSRRVAWLLNGHGAVDGIQAPYALGNIASDFRTENRYRIGGENVRKLHFAYPKFNTLEPLAANKTIIGHVLANSCSTSDFTMSGRTELEYLFTKLYQGNQRSFAEQLIEMPESGAMNTILNSDVGWGYQDNAFNRYFMGAVGEIRKKCHEKIGDAYKLAIYNMINGKKLFFQVHNRQFLGAPINPVAAPSIDCPINAESTQF